MERNLAVLRVFSSLSVFVFALPIHAQGLDPIEIAPTSAEPIFVATLPARTTFAHAYVPDNGQDSTRFQGDLARLGLTVGTYHSLTEANLGEALRAQDMVAVLPANLVANPVAGLMAGGYFAFKPTPDGLTPVTISAPDGRTLAPQGGDVLAAVPRRIVTPAEPETPIILGRELPRAGRIDLLLHNMRADTAILRRLLARSGLEPGQARLAEPGEAAAAVETGDAGVLFLSASQYDPEIAARRDLADIDVWVVTNYGLAPAWPAAFGAAPASEPAPIRDVASAADAISDAAPVVAAPEPPTPATAPLAELPEPQAPPYAVTDPDAVVLILPAAIPPSELSRINVPWRALIRELSNTRERQYYDPAYPPFGDAALARLAEVAGARGVDLQPQEDWLTLEDGTIPQAALDNMLQTRLGLAIRPTDLADPDLAPLLSDPRVALWALGTDGPVRIVDPRPDPVPDAVGLFDLPDTTVVALGAAGTDPASVPVDAILTRQALWVARGVDAPTYQERLPQGHEATAIRWAAAVHMGVREPTEIRRGSILVVDPETGKTRERLSSEAVPLADRLFLLRAEHLRDPRLAALRASSDVALHLLAFGQTIPVSMADDPRQAALDAHRLERARIVSEEGGIIAMPADGSEPIVFLRHYVDREMVYVGKRADGLWVAHRNRGNEIIGGFEAAIAPDRIVVQLDDPEGSVGAAFARDDAGFVVMPPRAMGNTIDLAMEGMTDGLFDGSHVFMSISRSELIDIPPLPGVDR